MFFILSKILAFLYAPILWIFTLLLLAIIFGKKRKKLLIAAFCTFYFFSNAFIFDEFMRAWEEMPGPDKEKKYDVAIVLGGHTSYDEKREMPGFHESSDRFLLALQLYKQGKVKKLLFSGGAASLSPPFTKESLVIRDYLISIGIPEKDILIEAESRNTHENAVYSKELLEEIYPEGSFLLITSGYHMPRSIGCFSKAGLNPDGFGVDKISGPRKYYPDHLLVPSAHVLSSWNILLHEWIGYLVYMTLDYI